MSTLITPCTRFLHVPKTGGTWVTGALPAAGVPVAELRRPTPGVLDPSHADLERTADHADRFTFAFVRHPLDWWRSIWGYRMRTGWNPRHPIDSSARSEDFNEFIEQVIENLAGFQSTRLTRYIGTAEDSISFIGRFEALVDDLVRALTLAGEEFDVSALRLHPPENVNDYERFPAIYDPELARRLAACERPIIARFYPEEPVPERFTRAALR